MDLTPFVNHLGKTVLHLEEEYLSYGITREHMICLNRESKKIPVPYIGTKLIFESQEEFRTSGMPSGLSIVRQNGKFVPAMKETDIDKENQILILACQCAKVDLDELNKNHKSKKRELVQVRQIHMAVRQLLSRNESLQKTGYIYHKDHATVLHAKKKIEQALEGYDKDFLEKYREVFELIKKKFGSRATNKFKGLEYL